MNTFGALEHLQSKFIWTVEDLLANISKVGSKLTSPEFLINANDTVLKWRAYAFYAPFGTSKKDGKNFKGIALRCSNANHVNCSIEMTVLNALNDEVFTCSKSNMNFKSSSNNRLRVFLVDSIIESKIDNSKKLKIIFSFTTSPYVEIKKHKNSKQAVELLQSNYFNPLTNLFNSKQFSDVTFNIEGKVLYAYKGILASRSPVFTAMFSRDMTEANCNQIDINDISYDTMYNLLQYVYTDVEPQFECDENQEKYKSLLIAADKYGLENLKLKMEKKLSLCIEVPNVFEYLNFADLHNAAQLKQEAIEFIISHNDEMAESEVYKNFSSLHPDVSCEVFRSLLIKKRKLE